MILTIREFNLLLADGGINKASLAYEELYKEFQRAQEAAKLWYTEAEMQRVNRVLGASEP